LGYNFRPTEIQAAFGLAQLKRLSGFRSARRANFISLMKFFGKYDKYFVLPEECADSEVHWLAFPLLIRPGAPFSRSELVTYLESRKIQTRPIFSGNILKHDAYKGVKHRVVGDLKNSQAILHNGFLLGLHHTLTKGMMNYVFSSLEEFLAYKTK